MQVNGTNLFMTRGDSESISVTFSGHEMQDGDFLEMTVRQRPNSPVVLYKKVTDFSGNKAIITIMPEETRELSVGDYVYDMQLTFGGSVKTIVKPSKFTIGEEVTYG